MLYSMFHGNKDEVIDKWVHYFPIYERFLQGFVNRSVLMIEIGVDRGGSLKMWKKYLGPFSTIVGIDTNPLCARFNDEQCQVHIGNQNDIQFLKEIIKHYGTPDIVIDDGSHIMEDMDTTFKFLYPLLNNNGVYIVEDTHTCYWPEFQGGLKKDGSFIEKAKNLIDSLNAYHIKERDMVDTFTQSTFSISFYDSVVVFEKRWRGKPYALQTGNYQL